MKIVEILLKTNINLESRDPDGLYCGFNASSIGDK